MRTLPHVRGQSPGVLEPGAIPGDQADPVAHAPCGARHAKGRGMRPYSDKVSSEALPPAAVVLMVTVRSVAKRNR